VFEFIGYIFHLYSFIWNVNVIIFFRYSEIADTKDFFNAAKKSVRMVVHFYRSVTPRCEIVDAHLSKLAFRYSYALNNHYFTLT
jgi:hypothetical protein